MTGQSAISITHVLLALYLPAPTYCFSVWIPLFPKYPFPPHNSHIISGYEPDLSHTTIIKNQFHILTFSSSNQYDGFRGNGLKLGLKHFWWTFLLLNAIFWFVSISIHVPKKIILKGFTQKRFDHILFGYAESRPNINNVEICLSKNFYICETKNSTNHCESLIDK